MSARDHVPRTIRGLLENSGLAWEAIHGGNHVKLFLEGRLIVVLPRASRGRERGGTHLLNSLTQVRRAIRESIGAAEGSKIISQTHLPSAPSGSTLTMLNLNSAKQRRD